MALAVFVSVLNNTMINVAIPLISDDLDISAGRTGWIVTGYSLVFATGIPIYGRISDFYSLRRTFSLALVVFAVGSLVCALAPSFTVLIVGRALQAAGSAAIPALAFGSVAKVFPSGSRGSAFGVLSSSVGVGAAAGPILGGLGVSIGGWQILFYGTFALILILFFAALYELPHTESEAPASGAVSSLDLPGGLLLAATAGLALFGITEIQQAGISSPLSWGTILLAVLAAIAFSARIRGAREPFASPELFRNRTFLAASSVALLAQFAYIGGGLFLTPLLLVGQGGFSALSTGLVLAPSAIAVAVLSPFAGRLSDRLGPRTVLLVSLTVLFFGLLFVSSYAVGASAYVVALGLFGTGVGYAGVTSPAANAASATLPEESAGVSLGIYQLFFFLGAGTGTAILGAFLAARQAAQAGALDPLYSAAPSVAPFSDAFLLASLAVLLAFGAALGINTRAGGKEAGERQTEERQTEERQTEERQTEKQKAGPQPESG
jgi:EmrB/QacA subfamily drug resistance transporter